MSDRSEFDGAEILPHIGQPISLRDKVYEILKERIVRGQFSAGHQLIANQLVKQLGVSRTPIREALHRLQVEGLVVASGSGISEVAALNHATIHSANEIRELLEVFACERAASTIGPEAVEHLRRLHRREIEHLSPVDEVMMSSLNTEIHRSIVAATDNPVLTELFEYLSVRVPSFRLFALGSREDLERFVEDHGRIIEAIADHDGSRACQLMSSHVRRAHKLLSAVHVLPENGSAED